MKYWITVNDQHEYELDLPYPDTLTWEEFCAKPEVQRLGQTITDITPESVLKPQELEKILDLDLDQDQDLNLDLTSEEISEE